MTGAFSDPSFVAALAAELKQGRPVALASLLATRGSMPRHAGARLAVLAGGSLRGTVGGGNVERIAEARARALLAGAAEPSIEWLTHEENEMACGGDALLAVRLLTAEDLPAFAVLADALEAGATAMAEEDWSDPAAPALSVTCGGKPVPRTSWDEETHRYVEPIAAPSTCHIFGAGHVGRALAALLPPIGFAVAVYDDRPEALDAAALPEGAHISCGSFEDLADAVPIGHRDSVVVLTHGHAADEAVLVRVLTRAEQPAYVGCIGSRRKAALVRDRLVAAGVARERAGAVHLPIGEDILAVTPQEIAVSIAAQLIRCRAERRNAWEGDRPR